jgi:hypothetical protein
MFFVVGFVDPTAENVSFEGSTVVSRMIFGGGAFPVFGLLLAVAGLLGLLIFLVVCFGLRWFMILFFLFFLKNTLK